MEGVEEVDEVERLEEVEEVEGVWREYEGGRGNMEEVWSG